jgi:Mycotoxin biosynthesis protein UstYa
MCNVDIGVFGSVWVHGKLTERSLGLRPFVDFNTQHVCRDFDAIRSWAEEHQQPEEPPHDFLEVPQPGDGVKINEGPP